MRAIEYCKKFTITHQRLESLLKKEVTSDYILTGEELEIYPKSIKPKIQSRGGKPKGIKPKPDPWNPDGEKKRAWIIKKK